MLPPAVTGTRPGLSRSWCVLARLDPPSHHRFRSCCGRVTGRPAVPVRSIGSLASLPPRAWRCGAGVARSMHDESLRVHARPHETRRGRIGVGVPFIHSPLVRVVVTAQVVRWMDVTLDGACSAHACPCMCRECARLVCRPRRAIWFLMTTSMCGECVVHMDSFSSCSQRVRTGGVERERRMDNSALP